MNIAKSKEVLRVDGLTVVHGDHEILNKIDFTLSRNEVLGIVGETGAGKSMLARTLIDLLPDGVEISEG
ncbi:ATP-binding cassette domain-containing protein, partial [Ensifer sp. P24N7]|uniref:ATP-binding cassette domain-containing protein n=1 Tax=Sinorhizobium sp. P24N7 TaxID=3348358 RepID=UPI0035F2955E